MPVAITDGALGLEARHIWTPPSGFVSGGIPAAALNDVSSLPYYRLNSIDGLHSLPDVDDERAQSVGRIGEIVYQGIETGKTVTYNGDIFGRTLQELRTMSNELRRVFGAMARDGTQVSGGQPGEGRMDIVPDPAYGSVEHYFTARCLSLVIGDAQQDSPSALPSPFRRPFVLTLRLGDPRVYESTQQSTTGNADGASVSLTNDGSAPTDPLFKVVVTTSNHLTLAKSTEYVLTLNNLIADTYWIDFRRRYAWRASDGADVTGKLDLVLSNWWDPGVEGLSSGPNDIGVVGGVWDCYWRHTSW